MFEISSEKSSISFLRKRKKLNLSAILNRALRCFITSLINMYLNTESLADRDRTQENILNSLRLKRSFINDKNVS